MFLVVGCDDSRSTISMFWVGSAECLWCSVMYPLFRLSASPVSVSGAWRLWVPFWPCDVPIVCVYVSIVAVTKVFWLDPMFGC
jgi:hypothetical protein